MADRPPVSAMLAVDWERLEADVVERIRALRAVQERLDAPPEVRARIFTDLVFPNVRLLIDFCAAVELDEEES